MPDANAHKADEGAGQDWAKRIEIGCAIVLLVCLASPAGFAQEGAKGRG
jgi:hypothetical protein